MVANDESGRPGRWIAPVPLLAGVACAFLGACVAGRVVSDHNCYDPFVRFHAYINPQTQYFPTASQFRALGRSRLSSDQIAVVVGGNSILFGHGQDPRHVWTNPLQAALGDRYRVLNFGISGQASAEFGEIGAEIIEREHPRMLFVTDLGAGLITEYPDGGGGSRYLFWDAYAKGMLPHDPRRDQRLAEWVKKREKWGDAPFLELRRCAWLDSWLYFEDLWTTLAYTRFCTVWTAPTAADFTRPRNSYSEGEWEDWPWDYRYPPSRDAADLRYLREWMGRGAALVQGPVDGCPFAQILRDCHPEAARRRTLLLVMRWSPHTVALLDPAERASLDALQAALVKVVETSGMDVLDIGNDYSDMDYLDAFHLSAAGGRRVAAEVAPKLQDMAKRLGHLQEAEVPRDDR